jgi:lysozyme family protein
VTELLERDLDALLLREGGLVDHPSDPGGLTNWGLSQRSYPHENLRTLTKDRAKDIYRKDYWTQPKFNEIPDHNLAIQVFDMGVNAGPGRAFRLLSRALKLKTEAPFWNPSLREALAGTTDWVALRGAFHKERQAYYRRLVAKNPKLGVFLKGWLRRAAEVAGLD